MADIQHGGITHNIADTAMTSLADISAADSAMNVIQNYNAREELFPIQGLTQAT